LLGITTPASIRLRAADLIEQASWHQRVLVAMGTFSDGRPPMANPSVRIALTGAVRNVGQEVTSKTTLLVVRIDSTTDRSAGASGESEAAKDLAEVARLATSVIRKFAESTAKAEEKAGSAKVVSIIAAIVLVVVAVVIAVLTFGAAAGLVANAIAVTAAIVSAAVAACQTAATLLGASIGAALASAGVGGSANAAAAAVAATERRIEEERKAAIINMVASGVAASASFGMGAAAGGAAGGALGGQAAASNAAAVNHVYAALLAVLTKASAALQAFDRERALDAAAARRRALREIMQALRSLEALAPPVRRLQGPCEADPEATLASGQQANQALGNVTAGLRRRGLGSNSEWQPAIAALENFRAVVDQALTSATPTRAKTGPHP
jgi:hypothetical protein